MLNSLKILSALGLVATALVATAFVGASAETVWKPPAEISGKAAAEGSAAAPVAENAAPAAPTAKVDKEKSCNEQIAAKGLKGKAKRQFKAECLK